MFYNIIIFIGIFLKHSQRNNNNIEKKKLKNTHYSTRTYGLSNANVAKISKTHNHVL